VTLHSALSQLSPSCRPKIYILDCGLGEDARARLTRIVQKVRPGSDLNWIEVGPERLANLPSIPRFPSVVYSRLLIPEILPPQAQRAVFLDADLIVGRDISPLFALDLGGSALGAVRDFGSGSHQDDPTRPYFNAGVLVIDVELWRHTGLSRRLVDHIASNDILPFQDQDALNAVIEPWLELDYAWNVQLGVLIPGAPVGWLDPPRLRALQAKRPADGLVLHYTGAKPWRPSQEVPDSLKWLRHNVRTGWDTPAEAVRWNLRWLAGRLRLRLGTERLRLRRALSSLGQRRR
jgi:lipopolysaccharide biosynthesis glycosyltransferase